MVVHLGFEGADIHGLGFQPVAQVLDFLAALGIEAVTTRSFDGFGQLGFQVGLIGGLVLAEFLFDLGQEVAFQELGNLTGAGVHDTVKAKVEVWLIELEEFLEQRFQFLEFLAHGGLDRSFA